MWTVIAAAIFTIVAGLLAFVTSMAVTKPISRTISQMDRISMMDFGTKPLETPRRSSLYEINAMEVS